MLLISILRLVLILLAIAILVLMVILMHTNIDITDRFNFITGAQSGTSRL